MRIVPILLLALFGMQKVFAQESPPLRVVPDVDFSRYAGTWYEIARLPNRFQQHCAGDVTATYTLRDDGELEVLNRCRSDEGDDASAEGRARLADAGGPKSKLKVRFAPAFLSFLPFVWGDYWIIDLDADYRYAVIGEPNREYLWILARTPVLPKSEVAEILRRAEGQGYILDSLIYTRQQE